MSLVSHDVSGAQLTDKYAVHVFNHFKNHFSEAETSAATALDRYIRLFRDDTVSGKTDVSQLLKQNSQAARDALRRGGISSVGASWFYFSNGLTILGELSADIGGDVPLAKNAETVISPLKTLLDKSPGPNSILPFWGDLYLGRRPCLLWRAAKRNFTPADIAATREVNERIQQTATLNESRWNDDLQRLLRLIRSLRVGGEGPLTEDQLALLARPEEKSQTEKKKSAERVSKFRAPESVPRPEIPAVPGVSAKDAGSEAGSSRSRERKTVWAWILPGLAALLLIGAAAWDFFGLAPWGSVLRPESVSDARDGVTSRDADSDDIGTDTVGTTGSLKAVEPGSTPDGEEEEDDDVSNGSDAAVSDSSSPDLKAVGSRCRSGTSNIGRR